MLVGKAMNGIAVTKVVYASVSEELVAVACLRACLLVAMNRGACG